MLVLMDLTLTKSKLVEVVGGVHSNHPGLNQRGSTSVTSFMEVTVGGGGLVVQQKVVKE